MDRLEAMTMLVAVVEKGSFSAASRELNVPLATLSRKITDLETYLGTRLLARTTRKLSLTDAGSLYLASTRVILGLVESAENEAAGEYQEPKGELVITAPILFGRLHILPIVTDFLENFPEINIRLQLSDIPLDIIEDHIDMAVRIGQLPDSSMIAVLVGSMRTVTCASPEYFSEREIPKHPKDIESMDWVIPDTPLPSPLWRYLDDHTGQPIEIRVHPRLTVTTAEGAVEASIRGIGLTRVLRYQAFDALQKKTLCEVLTNYEPPPLPVNLVHASKGRMPLKMRKFLDFAAPQLRQRLEEIDSFGNPAE